MTLTALTKSREQQLTNREIHSKKGSFKIETNFHLGIFLIKVCEIYLLYIYNQKRHSWLTCQMCLYYSERAAERSSGEKGVLRNSCSLITQTSETFVKIVEKIPVNK